MLRLRMMTMVLLKTTMPMLMQVVLVARVFVFWILLEQRGGGEEWSAVQKSGSGGGVTKMKLNMKRREEGTEEGLLTCDGDSSAATTADSAGDAAVYLRGDEVWLHAPGRVAERDPMPPVTGMEASL